MIKLLAQGGTNVLNSKFEYNRCLMPEICMKNNPKEDEDKEEEGEEMKRKKDRQEGMQLQGEMELNRREENKRKKQDNQNEDRKKRRRMIGYAIDIEIVKPSPTQVTDTSHNCDRGN